MAENNQNQNQNQQRSQEKTYLIRMKPGCGRMLIGRKYKTIDGDIVEKRPPIDKLLDTLDEWLEQGKTARVSHSMLEGLLNKDGKPARVVDGYPMRRAPGVEMTEDPNGYPLPKPTRSEDTWVPTNVVWDGDRIRTEHPDATFEIVPDQKAA